jgi:hypothetical protein
MIQQIITVASTLSGFIMGYGLKKFTKYFRKANQEYTYEEIEITGYEYIDLWDEFN